MGRPKSGKDERISSSQRGSFRSHCEFRERLDGSRSRSVNTIRRSNTHGELQYRSIDPRNRSQRKLNPKKKNTRNGQSFDKGGSNIHHHGNKTSTDERTSDKYSPRINSSRRSLQKSMLNIDTRDGGLYQDSDSRSRLIEHRTSVRFDEFPVDSEFHRIGSNRPMEGNSIVDHPGIDIYKHLSDGAVRADFHANSSSEARAGLFDNHSFDPQVERWVSVGADVHTHPCDTRYFDLHGAMSQLDRIIEKNIREYSQVTPTEQRDEYPTPSSHDVAFRRDHPEFRWLKQGSNMQNGFVTCSDYSPDTYNRRSKNLNHGQLNKSDPEYPEYMGSSPSTSICNRPILSKERLLRARALLQELMATVSGLPEAENILMNDWGRGFSRRSGSSDRFDLFAPGDVRHFSTPGPIYGGSYHSFPQGRNK